MTKAEEIYHRFVNYEWNEIGEGMKVSIIKAIDEALKEGQKLPNVVSGRSEQLCFCGQKLEIKVGDNRAWRECNNGHEQ